MLFSPPLSVGTRVIPALSVVTHVIPALSVAIDFVDPPRVGFQCEH